MSRDYRIKCDLCEAEAETATRESLGLLLWPRGWRAIANAGEDIDVCPACWKRLLGQIRAEVRAKP